MVFTVLLLAVCNYMEKASDFEDPKRNDKLQLLKAAIGTVGAWGTFIAAAEPMLGAGAWWIASVAIVALHGGFIMMGRWKRVWAVIRNQH
ncbi:hypothetical protein SAMN06295879_2114 [Agreia bicolorata]|uniref:Uncharacterized protein n=1 Tax=Agreia bicolorata TaxID=110935 RepID=A0A1T4Y334_9MICO|nr:hypothetical protein [Agreia bicolorata]KJC64639.1 hypothetical protein TZ00_09910 [Agreia bicolorata]SKA95898.1 hypothetical protein SAMN06295879_2114 [Agreia bicolorata]